MHSSGPGLAEPDPGTSYVAQALASRGSPGARNRSSSAALADARMWAEPGAAGVCSTLSIEQATTWRCICTLLKPRPRPPRPRLPLRLAKRRCHRRGSAWHITAHLSCGTRVLQLPIGRAGASQVRRRNAPPFRRGSVVGFSRSVEASASKPLAKAKPRRALGECQVRRKVQGETDAAVHLSCAWEAARSGCQVEAPSRADPSSRYRSMHSSAAGGGDLLVSGRIGSGGWCPMGASCIGHPQIGVLLPTGRRGPHRFGERSWAGWCSGWWLYRSRLALRSDVVRLAGRRWWGG